MRIAFEVVKMHQMTLTTVTAQRGEDFGDPLEWCLSMTSSAARAGSEWSLTLFRDDEESPLAQSMAVEDGRQLLYERREGALKDGRILLGQRAMQEPELRAALLELSAVLDAVLQGREAPTIETIDLIAKEA